jgi:hypothetical protein
LGGGRKRYLSSPGLREIIVEGRDLWYKKSVKGCRRGWENAKAQNKSGSGGCRIGLPSSSGIPRAGFGLVSGGRECERFSGLRKAFAPPELFSRGPSREDGPDSSFQRKGDSSELLDHLVTQLPEGGSFPGKVLQPVSVEGAGALPVGYQGKPGDDS